MHRSTSVVFLSYGILYAQSKYLNKQIEKNNRNLVMPKESFLRTVLVAQYPGSKETQTQGYYHDTK